LLGIVTRTDFLPIEEACHSETSSDHFMAAKALDRVTRWVCEKMAQNLAQSILYQNKNITFTVEKYRVKMWATSVIHIIENWPKVNCYSMFQNSPNLVTLALETTAKGAKKRFLSSF
jgi:hypothetical protein